jgi:hypothetical protein
MIDAETSDEAVSGISLTDDNELHVCELCWSALTFAERLEAHRQWRLTRDVASTLAECRTLLRAAQDGWHLPGTGLGEAGRN